MVTAYFVGYDAIPNEVLSRIFLDRDTLLREHNYEYLILDIGNHFFLSPSAFHKQYEPK